MLPFKSANALAQAALRTQAGSGCVGFCEENQLVILSPEKKLLETALTTKMAETGALYDTGPRDKRSTLVDK